MNNTVIRPRRSDGKWMILGSAVSALDVGLSIHEGHSKADLAVSFPDLPPDSIEAVERWMRGEGVDRTRELVQNSFYCLLCGSERESRHVHDFQPCSCQRVMGHGGNGPGSYWRRIVWTNGAGLTFIDTSIFVGDRYDDEGEQ